ncbi:MAG: hypothetical protein HUU16_19865 [Candidatus Omnitrophica bacterium]|nr:hypothetical protein [Candidatus Omnitrophota bacterium]
MELDQNFLNRLNSVAAEDRHAAVLELASLRESGGWTPPPTRPWMNLHAHTFHSYNSNGWSPSRLAYEALAAGLEILGTVDFDVLDAAPEILEVGEALGLRTVAGLESRVFVSELAEVEINSPGEPGIAYFMLTGCTSLPEPGTPAEETLSRLKTIAQSRNQAMIDKINAVLDPVRIDYTSEVLPRTPSGNPTERHLVEAFDRKAREVFDGDPQSLVAFWSERFALPKEEVEALLEQTVPFQETLRSKLMKRGGVGYIEPEPSRFPPVEEMIQLGKAIGALPTVAWLDGTSPGEEDALSLLELFIEKGVEALNIIPDRNWNLKNPEEKRIKVAKLAEVVRAARDLHLPLSIGTEMNKAGQPFVDNFEASELEPFVEDFRRGGRTLWGHTLLARAIGFGWMSRAAEAEFGDNRGERLSFFHEVGRRLQAGTGSLDILRKVEPNRSALFSAMGA